MYEWAGTLAVLLIWHNILAHWQIFMFHNERWIHPASGRIYSYSYKRPKVDGLDDETGEPLVQRPDDQPDKVRARLQQYDEVCSWYFY